MDRGLKVCDANGQSLAYVYSRENESDARLAEGSARTRRIASNIAKLPELMAFGLLHSANGRRGAFSLSNKQKISCESKSIRSLRV